MVISYTCHYIFIIQLSGKIELNPGPKPNLVKVSQFAVGTTE